MVKIVIGEDQKMLREAMVQLMKWHEEINIVADVSDGKSALNIIRQNSIDVAILDIEMPEMTGLEVLEKVRHEDIDIKVIIVTTFKRPGYFEKAVAYDVDAYVLKERSVDELVTTIHKVMSGEKEYSESLMTTILTQRNPLTSKEQLVLHAIGKGLSNRDISKSLFLSEGTIRNYTSIVIEKLNAENRFDAWRIAKDKGWV